MALQPGRQVKVLVTGFGPFLDIATNPSWEIARRLSPVFPGTNGEDISIVVPNEPIPAAYHKIIAQVPKLIQDHEPDLVFLMGLEVDSPPGVFKVEKSAPREGYHDIPDIDRRVLTRTENKRMFGKALPTLVTTLDLDTAMHMWQDTCSTLSLLKARAPTDAKAKHKSKEKQMVDVRLSDDVGTYVCGLIYYVSMLEMQKKTGTRNIVFFHIPRLESEEEIQVGTRVTEEVIKALVAVYK